MVMLFLKCIALYLAIGVIFTLIIYIRDARREGTPIHKLEGGRMFYLQMVFTWPVILLLMLMAKVFSIAADLGHRGL